LTSLPNYQERLSINIEEWVSWMRVKGVNLPERKLQKAIDPAIAMRLSGNLVSALSHVMMVS